MAAVAMSALLLSLVPAKASAISLPTCSVEIVSNTNASVGSGNAVGMPGALNGAWTANIPGATWIWGDDQTATTSGDVTYTFENQFGFVGTVTSATLYVASDNGHDAALNSGTTHTFGSSFNNVQIYDVAADIAQGDNELNVTVTNAGPQGNYGGNPAGALYKLTILGTPTTDSDCSIDYGDEVPVLGCTDREASNFNPEATSGNEQAENCSYVEPVCEIGENLLDNGSFEEPAIEGSYSISNITFWSITKVLDGTPTLGELWRGIITPSDGLQNVELAANEPTQITQTVTTVPGATYELRFDFAARSENAADNNVDALVEGNVLMNANTGNTAWTTYSQTFVAGDNSTDIALRDVGTSEGESISYGSLVDNAVLCYVSDPVVVEEDTYRIEGFVYDDNNRNAVRDEEEGLAGRVVNITNNEEGEALDNRSTETDANGFYFFEVPAGTWTITETVPDGWDLTSQESHVVTVPGDVPVEINPEVTLLDSIVGFLVPTAHAAVIGRPYGPFNFGNDEERRSGGGGGGNRAGDRDNDDSDDNTPDGEVLGDSDSAEPLVLGEQVTAVPTGAPNAGAGGTAPRTIEFFSGAPVALLGRTKKHG